MSLIPSSLLGESRLAAAMMLSQAEIFVGG
jgi:hypothetical protein